MDREQEKNEQPPDRLDESWFDRPDQRRVVNELRARLEKIRIRDEQSLDDSWFR